MADELKPCQPDCPYCAAMDKGHLVDALRAEVLEKDACIVDLLDQRHDRDQDIANLRAEVERQRKENESLAEADLTYAMETKELRAEVEWLKAEGWKYLYSLMDTAEKYQNAVLELDALRAEVAKYRGMEVENAALRNDNEALRAERDEAIEAVGLLMDESERLKAELAKYTEPLTQEQVERVHEIFTRNSGFGNWQERDAAIRAAREGER